MPSIRTTNNRRRSRTRRTCEQARDSMLAAYLLETEKDECGQCEGTGTIEDGLSGDGHDEECPVCDGTGRLPEDLD